MITKQKQKQNDDMILVMTTTIAVGQRQSLLKSWLQNTVLQRLSGSGVCVGASITTARDTDFLLFIFLYTRCYVLFVVCLRLLFFFLGCCYVNVTMTLKQGSTLFVSSVSRFLYLFFLSLSLVSWVAIGAVSERRASVVECLYNFTDLLVRFVMAPSGK